MGVSPPSSERRVCIVFQNGPMHLVFVVNLKWKMGCKSDEIVKSMKPTVRLDFDDRSLYQHAVCVLGSTLYVFNGCNARTGEGSNSMYTYELPDDASNLQLNLGMMTEGPSMHDLKNDPTAIPTPCGKILVFSSYRGLNHRDFELYDPATEKWRKLPSILPVMKEKKVGLGAFMGMSFTFVEQNVFVLKSEAGVFNLDIKKPGATWKAGGFCGHGCPCLQVWGPASAMIGKELCLIPSQAHDIHDDSVVYTFPELSKISSDYSFVSGGVVVLEENCENFSVCFLHSGTNEATEVGELLLQVYSCRNRAECMKKLSEYRLNNVEEPPKKPWESRGRRSIELPATTKASSSRITFKDDLPISPLSIHSFFSIPPAPTKSRPSRKTPKSHLCSFSNPNPRRIRSGAAMGVSPPSSERRVCIVLQNGPMHLVFVVNLKWKIGCKSYEILKSMKPTVRLDFWDRSLYQPAVCVLGSTLYVFNGCNASTGEGSNSMYTYELPDDASNLQLNLGMMTEGPSMHDLKNDPRAIPTPCGKILVFSWIISTYRGLNHRDFELYDLATEEWRKLPSILRVMKDKKVGLGAFMGMSFTFVEQNVFVLKSEAGVFNLDIKKPGATWKAGGFCGHGCPCLQVRGPASAMIGKELCLIPSQAHDIHDDSVVYTFPELSKISNGYSFVSGGVVLLEENCENFSVCVLHSGTNEASVVGELLLQVYSCRNRAECMKKLSKYRGKNVEEPPPWESRRRRSIELLETTKACSSRIITFRDDLPISPLPIHSFFSIPPAPAKFGLSRKRKSLRLLQ